MPDRLTSQRIVRLGEWESRHDAPPVRRYVPGYGDTLISFTDRRVYEFWTENGQRVGRWTWESGVPGHA
jgi:hypothetical protein